LAWDFESAFLSLMVLSLKTVGARAVGASVLSVCGIRTDRRAHRASCADGCMAEAEAVRRCGG